MRQKWRLPYDKFLTLALNNNNNIYNYEHYIKISKSLSDQQIGGPSLGWVYQALKETRALSKLKSPSVPCVTFCGAEDVIVAIDAAKERMRRWRGGQLDLVENARHDVLCEVPEIRTKVISSIDALFTKSADDRS